MQANLLDDRTLLCIYFIMTIREITSFGLVLVVGTRYTLISQILTYLGILD